MEIKMFTKKIFAVAIFSILMLNYTWACTISGGYNQNQIGNACPAGDTELTISSTASTNGTGWPLSGTDIVTIRVLSGGSLDASKNITFGAIGQIIFEEPIAANAITGAGIITINGTTYTTAEILAAGGVNQDGVLDVELGSFEAKRGEDNVNLYWETLSEDNNYGFEIERNTNGDWENIGFVSGAGDSYETIQYTYEDNEPKSGTNYYRLRIIDFSGTIEYSPIKSVEIKNDLNDIVQINPNPASDVITVQAAQDEETNVMVFSINGQLVLNKNFTANTTLDVSNFEQGVYFMVVKSENYTLQKKISIIH